MNGRLKEKRKAMKKLIAMIVNDENYPKMMMIVLQYVHTLDDHDLKKLLFIYWEVSL